MVLGLLAAAPRSTCAQQTTTVQAPLRVGLSTTTALSEAVRAIVTSEVRAIWAREGVTIAWAPMPLAGAGVEMRVLVVSTAERAPDRDGHHWPVAQLLRDGERGSLAVASVSAARRVLEAAGLAGEPLALTDHRLGVVIGRAIAHEIGHHLLGTSSHARHGLMRARIEAHALADLRDVGFGLEADAALRARAALTQDAAAWQLAPFMYRP